MRILLTGGAGFIGTAVRHVLAEQDHEVRVLDLVATDAPGDDDVVGDVRDPSAVDTALRDVETVIHLAAKVGLGVDVQDLPDYADHNVRGTAVLLAGMARARVGRLVLASSMVVYGEGLGRCPVHGEVPPAPRPEDALRRGEFESPCPRCGRPLEPVLVDEDAPVDPRNAYAASKAGQEQFADSWARATGGSAVALRYHNVYGPGMPRNTPYAGVAAIFASALRSGDAPRVFEDGGQRRDFVHVEDVARATVAATGLTGPGVQSLNVGSGHVRTVGDMAAALAAAANGPTPVVTGEYRLGDVRHITADSSRARERLDWTARRDFGRGVAELMQ
ncbi:NAD-dependent epimerase/dehydratase family protein [Jatrophihabitans sp. YIM 134969]